MLTSIILCASLAMADVDSDVRVAAELAKQKTLRSRKHAAPAARRFETMFRDPVGHTHTCRNGHTWDHSVTSSHNCPVCGQYQNVQDRTPRKVQVQRLVEIPAPIRVVPQSSLSPVIRLSQPNCPNGNCPYVR